MEQHLQECPLELIKCEKCNKIMRRKDMGKHMKVYKKEHADKLAVTEHKLKEELATKTAELKNTSKSNCTIS